MSLSHDEIRSKGPRTHLLVEPVSNVGSLNVQSLDSESDRAVIVRGVCAEWLSISNCWYGRMKRSSASDPTYT